MTSVRATCPQCPFRSDSPLCYDADAAAALRDGNEPSCHSVVGLGVIFADLTPDNAKRCVGHDLWVEGAEGFSEPRTE